MHSYLSLQSSKSDTLTLNSVEALGISSMAGLLIQLSDVLRRIHGTTSSCLQAPFWESL